MSQTFIDSIQDVAITNGTVRVNCLQLIGQVKENDEIKARAVPSTQLVMTPDTFLQLHGMFNRVFQELSDRGVIRPRAGGGSSDSLSDGGGESPAAPTLISSKNGSAVEVSTPKKKK